jgi:hypothetical protein
MRAGRSFRQSPSADSIWQSQQRFWCIYQNLTIVTITGLSYLSTFVDGAQRQIDIDIP